MMIRKLREVTIDSGPKTILNLVSTLCWVVLPSSSSSSSSFPCWISSMMSTRNASKMVCRNVLLAGDYSFWRRVTLLLLFKVVWPSLLRRREPTGGSWCQMDIHVSTDCSTSILSNLPSDQPSRHPSRHGAAEEERHTRRRLVHACTNGDRSDI